MGIQSYFIEKKIKKLISREQSLQVKELSKINKVAILIDDTATFDDHQFKILKKMTPLKSDSFSMLAITHQKADDQKPRNHYILRINEINMFGAIKSDGFQEFIKEDYDLLIDYTDETERITRLVVAQIKAKLKAGFGSNSHEFYNIILNVKPDNVEAFNRELIRYLTILKVI